MKFIDSHCHLNFDYAPKTDTDLVQEAEAAGVEALITIGTELETFPKIQEISNRFPNVFHTIGIHPHDSITLNDSDFPTLEKAARHPKCRAIGEIGLDYYYGHSPKEIQIRRLEQQLELALALRQPVVIHSRDGEEDLLRVLKTYAQRVPSDLSPGVIHCFSGTPRFGQECLDLGFYISFSGILTFKKAEEVREGARIFPLEKILIETDAPFLAPVPFRGKKCEPKMVKLTAEKLAEIKNLPLAEIAEKTTRNAKKLFRIETVGST